MKKILCLIAAFVVLSISFFAMPQVIYAEPEYVIRNLEAEHIAQAETVDDTKPIFIAPAEGTITSEFGYRTRGFHHGLDIANEWGTLIVAIADGTVTEACWKSSVYGYAVVIDHGKGWESLYGHCGMLTVEAGDQVKAGDIIAIVGSTGRSTGPHVHLEIQKDGVFLNPLDFVEITNIKDE